MVLFISFGMLRSLYESLRALVKHVEKDSDEENEISSIDI
jgi:hypothetical protein